ncbi:MBL fold metallo-hydrolase [Streptomyces sp. NPDC018019]|uniref:MBL fold metallo-hydrolase n=1 Tax=Streptomyces sp. NPDC018019 TaxID=3365030 RepID=UPI00378A55B1
MNDPHQDHVAVGELRTQEIRPGVHAFIQGDGSWGWSNAGLVHDGGEALLIDTFFTLPQTRRLLSAVASAAPGARVTTVVNTHLNGDHCHGNQLVEGARTITSACGAFEVGHEVPAATYEWLQSHPPEGASGGYVTRHFGGFDFSGIQLTPPDVTFNERFDLEVGRTAVELLELGPAHTHGDVAVHVPDASTVFCGDLLFQGDHPVVWSGPLLGWADACERLLATGATTFVPGHGPVAGRADVEGFAEYLLDIHEQASAAADAGLPVEDATAQLKLDAYGDLRLPERTLTAVAAVYRERGLPAPAAPLELLGPMARLSELFPHS